jgi:predicted MFS family arabinose efflux permease
MCLVFTGELTLYVYSVLILLITFVWNIGLPYLLGMIADSDVTGRLVVLIVAAQAGGTAVGPLIAGQVVELKGLENLGYSSALFCGLALVVLLVFLARFKKFASLSDADVSVA